MSVTVGVAGSVANDVTNENDVIIRTGAARRVNDVIVRMTSQ